MADVPLTTAAASAGLAASAATLNGPRSLKTTAASAGLASSSAKVVKFLTTTAATAGLAASAAELHPYFWGDGTITMGGSADLSLFTFLEATGTVLCGGSAWLTPRDAGVDTLTAVGSIRFGGMSRRGAVYRGPTVSPVRLRTTESWSTSSGTWTVPTIVPPDIREDA